MKRIAIVLLALSAPAWAGKPDFRAEAPRPAGKVAFRAPKVTKLALANGIPVWVVQRKELPLVTVQVIVRAGGELAPSEHAGLPSLTATMLDEGAGGLSALDIAEQAEALGAQLGTGSSMESAYVSASTLSETLEPTLDLMAKVLLEPSFDAKELERVRNDRLTDIMQVKDSPRRLVGQLMAALLFGGTHPYGMPDLGTETSVHRITREDIQRFYQTYYHPYRAAIVAAGDVEPRRLLALLEARFGAWADPQRKDAEGMAILQASRARIVLLDRPGAPQSEVRVGTLGIARSSPDYALSEVTNAVFGGNFAARLNMNLREKNGYTYGAYSRAIYRAKGGYLVAGGGIKAAVTALALKEILGEIEGMAARAPSAQELGLAKNSIVLSLAGMFESNAQVAGTFGELMTFGLPADSYDKLPAQVKRITAKQVVDFAKKTWSKDSLVIGVIGPRKDIEASLADVGAVDIVDDARWKVLFP